MTPLKYPDQSGFGFSLMAVVIALVMGLAVSIALRQVSTQSAELGDMYAASQARWTAMSGVEWGIHKAELGEDDVLGTFAFFNSSVTIDTSASDENGSPLTTNWYRVMSVGTMGDAESRMRIIAAFSLQTAWADVSIIEQKADIKSNFTLNDSLYIGDDIDVEAGASMGDPPGEPTHIYHPISATVTGGQEDAYFTSGVHPSGDLFLPDFDNTYYDALIDIAKNVSSTSGNKIKGDTKWKRTTLDLSTYTNSTLYVNGKVTFEGTHITGGTVDAPGILVTDEKLKLKRAKAKKGNPELQTTADDNIILISKKDIQVEDESYFGEDWSAMAAVDRPVTTNELYAKDDLKISKNTVVWGQIYCRDDIKLEGKVYGICLAPDKFTFEKNESYLEGAVFAKKLNSNELKKGQMVLNHIFHDEYFKIINYGVEDNSLFEY
ncbi:MAG: hypothetical protein L3J79_01950 [Candidatus Marinimicrobia bacterium]|nr:hypothetical protein [Candidatus Neomarinimicrobiota bacterium]